MADHTWRDTYLRMRAADPNRSVYTPTDSVIEESRFVETVVPGSEADIGSRAALRRTVRVRRLVTLAVLLCAMLCIWLAMRLFLA